MTKKTSSKKRVWGAMLPGLFLVVLGVGFLLNNYGITTFNIGKLWPVFLIIPGVFILSGMHHKD
jgi:hypothetical protein